MKYDYKENRVTELKIAYIGGGSRGWARTLMSDLAMCEDMSGDVYLYDIDYVLTNFNKITIHENAEKYYINGGIIDERRFIEKDFNENDELVRVYSSKEFIGIGKIIRKDNTISVKSDKLFIV